MHKNILVTGSKGQVGSELEALSRLEIFSHFTFFFTDKDSLDIINKSAINTFCKKNKITTIVNCAAYTAVDKAEEDQEIADLINHQAVRYMAEIAKQKSIQLIHISTDYVFDGKNYKPYVEEDTVNPQGIYGQTKLDGEEALINVNPANAMIIRTSWVYSSFGNNFVKTMVRLGRERDTLGVIFDQIGTPTYARDLADTILKIIDSNHELENKSVPIYHYSNEGVCSWYDFAKEIFAIENIECKVKPILTSEYPTPAKRPHYSLLNKNKIKCTYGIEIPHWKESLRSCLILLD